MHPSRLRSLAATLIAIIAVGIAAVPGASAASPCSRYASPAGSDSAPGTADAPYRTAQALAISLQPGETGCLKAGTYDQEVEGPYVIRFNHGGAPGRPITVRNAPGESVTLHGIVFVPHGSDDVTLSGVSIDGRRPGGGSPPVSLQVMAANTTIEDIAITNHGARSCMMIGSDTGWGRAERTIVRRSVFRDCGDPGHGMLDHAIYSNNVDGVEIVDNLFLRSAGFAVHLYPNTKGGLVAHNVMVGNGGGVIFGGWDGMGSSGNVVEKNVISGSTKRAGLSSWWGEVVGTGNVARSNCLDNPKGNIDAGNGGFLSTGAVEVDPQFADAGGDDYRLRSSRCLGAVGYDTAAKLDGLAPAAAAQATPVGERGALGRAHKRSGRSAKAKRRARAKRARARRAHAGRTSR